MMESGPWAGRAPESQIPVSAANRNSWNLGSGLAGHENRKYFNKAVFLNRCNLGLGLAELPNR